MTYHDPMAALAAWQEAHPPAQEAAPVQASALDHPNGSLTASEAMRLGLFGEQHGWGPAVTDASSMQVGTVYSCLTKMAGAVSQLPLHEYTVKPDGERQRISPHTPLWWLLNESPSPAWTATTWKQWIVRCVKLRGDQHTEILRNLRGDVTGLVPHHPDAVIPVRVGDRIRYNVMDPFTGHVHGVDQDDMLHFTGFGFDGLRSMSAIKWAARNAIASELGAANYVGRSVADGGMPRVMLQYPAALNEADARLLRDNFLATYGGPAAGKMPMVLAHGGTAKELSISPVDMELLAARKFDKQTICEVMGVPPIIIGDSEKTSAWGTGVEQITLGWVRFDIQPMLCGWEEEINRKINRRAGRFLEFSLDALLRGDSKAQAEAFRAALGGPGTGDGWVSVNEVRALKNHPRLTDPDADVPFKAQRATPTPTPAPAP